MDDIMEREAIQAAREAGDEYPPEGLGCECRKCGEPNAWPDSDLCICGDCMSQYGYGSV
jgi:hypothetical protein